MNAVASVGVKTAVSECEPSASTAMTDADPAATGWVDPTWVAPSMSVTVPAAPDGVTVAVSVSVDPCATGDAGATFRAVVVDVAPAGETVYATALDVDAVNAVASVGVKTAVRECEPSASTVVTEADPVDRTCVAPTCVAPSMNFTVPAAPDGVTVAVSVSVDPWAAGDAGSTFRAVVVEVGPAGFTVNDSALEVDAVKFAGLVGVNAAVIECVPTVSVVVAGSAAMPPLTATGEPRLVAPSLNWTEPTTDAGVTVAVNVTEVPDTTGLTGSADTAVVVVTAGDVMMYDSALEVDAVKFAGLVGVNAAVIECVPTVSVVVAGSAAMPPLTATGEPRLVAPSLNWTEPTTDAGVTVAVKTTDVPLTTGLGGLPSTEVVVVTAGDVIVYDCADDVDPLKAVV